MSGVAKPQYYASLRQQLENQLEQRQTVMNKQARSPLKMQRNDANMFVLRSNETEANDHLMSANFLDPDSIYDSHQTSIKDGKAPKLQGVEGHEVDLIVSGRNENIAKIKQQINQLSSYYQTSTHDGRVSMEQLAPADEVIGKVQAQKM